MRIVFLLGIVVVGCRDAPIVKDPVARRSPTRRRQPAAPDDHDVPLATIANAPAHPFLVRVEKSAVTAMQQIDLP